MSKLEIIALNVNGIRGSDKLNMCLAEIYNLNADIYLLSDTRLNNSKNIDFKNHIRGYKIYSNLVHEASRGVSILIRNSLNIEVLDSVEDIIGNYILLKIRFDNVDYVIRAVYGPNETNLHFYDELYRTAFNLGTSNVLLGGDMNMHLNFSMDSHGNIHPSNPQNSYHVRNLNESHSMEDVYRIKHPDGRQYTYYRDNPIKRSRLDYIFCTPSILTNTCHIEILPTAFSDHSPVRMIFDYHKIVNAKAYWKIPSNIIKNPEFKELVLKAIRETYGTYHKYGGTDNYLLHCTENDR